MGEPQPRVAVVDLKNHFLRWEDRRIVHRDQLFHRSIHILLFDHSGRFVIQRRHASKLTFPDCWDVSCSGHVEEADYLAGPDERLDEVYAGCAGRELMEELGVIAPLEPLGEFKPIIDVHYECLALYRATSDGPYVPQPDEVAEIRAVTVAEFGALLGSDEKTTPTLRWFGELAVSEGWFR